MPDTKPDNEKTWLLDIIRKAGFFWRDYFSIGGWLPLYQKEVNGTTPRVHRRLHVFDAIWAAMLVLAVVGWFGLYGAISLESAESAVMAAEVADPAALAKAWSGAGPDSPQGRLWQRLPLTKRRAIQAQPSAQTLADALNGLILQKLPIDELVNADTALPSHLDELLPQADRAIGRSRLNRGLIESLFPGQIAESRHRPKFWTCVMASGPWACATRAVAACILFRLLDMLINVLNVCPFGVGAVRAGSRPPEINRRLVLLNLMSFMELIFWNAILLFYLEECGLATFREPFSGSGSAADALVHSLQTSFSTVSTIGYGTYAPNNMLAVLLTLMEVFTGMLLISLAAAQTISLTTQEDKKEESNPAAGKIEMYAETAKWVWLRNYLPPIVTTLLIVVFYGFLQFYEIR